MFLFDTDHLSIIQGKAQPEYSRLTSRIARHSATLFFTPTISFHEQSAGWIAYVNRARDTAGIVRGYQMMEQLLSNFSTSQIASFDAPAADMFESLRTQRIRIGTMDLRIAAIALVKGFTLLSRNLADFRQVPGLRVEDWTI